MNSRRTSWFAALLLLLAAEGMAAETNSYQTLVDNSPFLTPAFKARLGRHDTISLTFIGYTRIGDKWFFALLDRKSGNAYWLKADEEVDGIKIERFDEKEQSIHLTIGGIGSDLMLEKG